jgi:purine-binding chemotaxis protein CheW
VKGDILTELGRQGGVSLLFRVDSRVCALHAEHVSETMRPLPVEPLAGAPSFVLGVSVVRGSPIPVVDAARMLGATGPSLPRRFVALRIGGRSAALAVDAVLGVVALATGSLEELPPLLRDASTDVIEAMGTHDGNLLLVLRSARIVPASVWAAFDAREVHP